MADGGVSGGLNGTSQPILMIIAAFTAIAWYNCVELNVMIWMRFKKHRGLYFWSLLISSWGIVIHAFGFLAKFFQIWNNDFVSVTLICIGWYCMVTGQSLVLYSRLHLIMHDKRKIRWVLYMIITDVFLFHVPTTVLVYGANSSHAAVFTNPYSIMEKIQITAFALQEGIISGLYVYHTYNILKPGAIFQKSNTKRVMRHLIVVNVFIIFLDFSLLGTEFANHYEIQTTYKSVIYSIKLKLEFDILNQLVKLTRGSVGGREAFPVSASVYSSKSGQSRSKDSRPSMAREWSFPTPFPFAPGRRLSGKVAESYSVSATSTGERGSGIGLGMRGRDKREEFVLKTVDVDVTISDAGSGRVMAEEMSAGGKVVETGAGGAASPRLSSLGRVIDGNGRAVERTSMAESEIGFAANGV